MNKQTAFDLNTVKANRHSQDGEDGILAALFERKEVKSGYFCEFGAWDGKHLSNSYGLYEDGWLGCYIEGEPARVEDLKRNITRQGMELVCAFVKVSGPDSLDSILADRLPSGGLDLLSIDIDSDDLAIWESLKEVRPNVVIIEFNPTIPFDTRYKNPPGKTRGNAALSIYEFAVANGYDLVAMTHCNLIFVNRAWNADAFKTFTLSDFSHHTGQRFFFGYDGTLIRAIPSEGQPEDRELFRVPWSRTIFPQPIHSAFRKFKEGSLRARAGGVVSMLVTAARRPLSAFRRLGSK